LKEFLNERYGILMIKRGDLMEKYIIGIVFMLLVVVFFKTPIGKGMIGEWVVRFFMGKNRPKKDTFIIHDLMFYDGAKSVQIDHVLINAHGVHVIETKNYGGMIYGKENDKEWTQVLSFGKVKHTFYNPIKQNQGHLQSLKQVMPMKSPIYSYIVFTGRATLRVKTEHIPVIYPLSLMKQIGKHRKDSFRMKSIDVRKLYDALKDLKKTNTIIRQEHIQGIEQRKVIRKGQHYESER